MLRLDDTLPQLAEMDIIEAIEKLTDPLRKEGQWISHIDLQEQGTKLALVDMGKVRARCSTWIAHML